MGVLSVISVVLSLLGGVASSMNKAGLANEAAAISNAIAELEKVIGSDVTKAQLEGLRVDPNW